MAGIDTTAASMPLVEITHHSPVDAWGRAAKRTIDVFGAAVGLLLLAPTMLLIALIIKITDPGPVLYRQHRLSRNQKRFNLFKFRTMHVQYSIGEGYGARDNAEAFEALGRPDLIDEFAVDNKLQDDPRVSRVGRFLRRTSLDELPQLINVLLGELSLIGPRPMLEEERDRFGPALGKVLSFKCGITGLWQVSGRADVGFEGRLKHDLEYVDNWSLWLDFKILVKTLVLVVFGRSRGAY